MTLPSMLAPIVVMGVSGCGKTTVGELLARDVERPFLDADELHSPECNRAFSASSR